MVYKELLRKQFLEGLPLGPLGEVSEFLLSLGAPYSPLNIYVYYQLWDLPLKVTL